MEAASRDLPQGQEAEEPVTPPGERAAQRTWELEMRIQLQLQKLKDLEQQNAALDRALRDKKQAL